VSLFAFCWMNGDVERQLSVLYLNAANWLL
jgi:hypothetical protein